MPSYKPSCFFLFFFFPLNWLLKFDPWKAIVLHYQVSTLAFITFRNVILSMLSSCLTNCWWHWWSRTPYVELIYFYFLWLDVTHLLKMPFQRRGYSQILLWLIMHLIKRSISARSTSTGVKVSDSHKMAERALILHCLDLVPPWSFTSLTWNFFTSLGGLDSLRGKTKSKIISTRFTNNEFTATLRHEREQRRIQQRNFHMRKPKSL